MRRREFIGLVGGVVAACLLMGTLIAPFSPEAEAQDKPLVRRVAGLDWASPSPDRLEPFRKALQELGHVEGENILVEYWSAEGRTDRADMLAKEIVGRQPTVIVAYATPAAHAVKRATATIPIVVATADPVGTGLVTNLARPGGNLTGVSNMMPDLESKRLELLRELLPGLKRIAFLGSTRDPATVAFVREAKIAAEHAGLHFSPVLVGSSEEVDAALAGIVRDKVDAVIVQPLFALHRSDAAALGALAASHRIPVITNYAHFPQSGGLLSYGPHVDFARRAAARYVDRILKGASPGELAVEQPAKFEMVINLKTANALGLTVPASLLARADEVIE